MARHTNATFTFYTEDDEEITVRGSVYFGRTPSNGDDPTEVEIEAFERKGGEDIPYSVGLEMFHGSGAYKTLREAEEQIESELFEAAQDAVADAMEARDEWRAEMRDDDW